MNYRELLKDKKRIVVKIGSSSLQHPQTGDLDYIKLEKLARELCDIRNQGKDVVLVSSGAIAVGKKAVNPYTEHQEKPVTPLAFKQACAAVGQARLMMTYQKLFAEYNQIVAQILMTKNTVVDDMNRFNAHNTFTELLKMGIIPIVNENDTIASYEINYEKDSDTLIGDNDTLSAIVGLYTDDPHKNPDAKFIPEVEKLTEEYWNMGKASTGSNVGTGGMNTKMAAARIATGMGADMLIANSRDVGILHRLLAGEQEGTLFAANREENFDLKEFVNSIYKH